MSRLKAEPGSLGGTATFTARSSLAAPVMVAPCDACSEESKDALSVHTSQRLRGGATPLRPLLPHCPEHPRFCSLCNTALTVWSEVLFRCTAHGSAHQDEEAVPLPRRRDPTALELVPVELGVGVHAAGVLVKVEKGARPPVERPRAALDQARYIPQLFQESAYGFQVVSGCMAHRL